MIGDPITHVCAHPGCTGLALYGVGVASLAGRQGTWYCADHLPEDQRPGARRQPARSDDGPGQGSLL